MIEILKETTTKPITLIGKRAGTCWGSDTSDDKKNFKRGMQCLMDNHGRTFEFVNVEMLISGYSARCLREFYTHIGCLPTRLQDSTRYIDFSDFEYTTPNSVLVNKEAKEVWDEMMSHMSNSYIKLKELGIPKEDCALGLPIGYHSKMVDKRNLRNWIDMSHQRLCTRANWEYRNLMNDVMKALSEISTEWRFIIDNYFVPKCEVCGFCTEKKCCGRKPYKEMEFDMSKYDFFSDEK